LSATFAGRLTGDLDIIAGNGFKPHLRVARPFPARRFGADEISRILS